MFKTLRDSLKFLLDDDLMEDDLMEVAFEEVFPKLFQKIAHTKYPIEY